MDMVRICGLIAVFAACTLAGSLKSRTLSKRVRELETVLSALTFISTEIRYFSLPTATLLEKLDANTDYKKLRLFGLCQKKLQETQDFQKAWRSTIEESKQYLALNREDIGALLGFGDLFGTTDSDGQLANCARYCELFRLRLSDAVEDRKRLGRLYGSLGVLTGVFFALILY